MRYSTGCLAIGLCVLACGAQVRADVITNTLDDFTGPATGLPTTTSSDIAAVYDTGVNGVLGGSRGYKVTHVTPATGSDSVSASIDTGAGTLTYSSTSGASGWLDLAYGGQFEGIPAGLSGIVFSEPVSAGSTISFHFDAVSGVSPANPLAIAMALFDVQSSTTYDPFPPTQVTSNGAQTVTYTFPAGTGIANLNDVNFYFEAPVGASYVLDSITLTSTVTPTPEPASAMALVVGGIVLGSRRRRDCRAV